MNSTEKYLFPLNLADLLDEHGDSVKQAAEKTGVSDMAIYGILYRKSRAEMRTIWKIARGYGVTIDSLFEKVKGL